MKVMQDPTQVIAFVTFTAVVAGTPGPSNALLTAIGASAGVRRGLASVLGQVTGMSAMLFAIALGLGDVLLAHPVALQILKWSGAAMLCLMAWRIATANPASPAESSTPRPAGFLGMAAFQWVNPKGWLIGVAASTTFLDRSGGGILAQAIVFAVLFGLVAIPSCLPWLAFGAALQRFITAPRARRILNGVMAVMLAASTILLVWTRLPAEDGAPGSNIGPWRRQSDVSANIWSDPGRGSADP